MATRNMAAIPVAERVEVLDALRGFALFGILLANILYWSGWIFMKAPDQAALAGQWRAEAQGVFHHLLVDGKFYTLFSLLFGIGFSLQLSRLEKRGTDGVAIYRRRLLVLLAIGLVHMVFIWDGDILTLYALLGLTLPLFRRWSERALIAAAAILLLLPLPGAYLFERMGWQPQLFFYALGDNIARGLGGTPGQEIAWMAREDPQAFVAWTLGGWPYRIGNLLEGWRIPKVLGIMLLGLLLGRRLAVGGLIEDRRLLWWTLALGLAIGLPASLAYALASTGGQAGAASIVGTVPLGIAYAAGFVLAWPRARPVLALLAPAGRMALTNYLMHSLLGILIFYGIGLGLAGKVGPAGFYATAAAIFAFQIVASRLWLTRFEQGPMERLWRLGTYGRRR